MRMKDLTKISKETYDEVYKRDSGMCIVCGKRDVQCAHYIPRSQGGYGVPQNLGMLCVSCHTALDNGNDENRQKVIKQMFRLYLETQYAGWNEEDYKWKGKVYESR